MSQHKAIDLIGKTVRVTNPRMHTSWVGQAIAFTEVPALLIELEGGHRMMLRADWAVEATPDSQEASHE